MGKEGNGMRIRMGMGAKRTAVQVVNSSRRRSGLSGRRASMVQSARNGRMGNTTRMGALRANTVQGARLEERILPTQLPVWWRTSMIP